MGKERGVSALLATLIRAGLFLLLLTPFIVTFQTIFPYVVGKALYARGLIAVLTVLWLILLLHNRSFLPRSWTLVAFWAYLLVSLLAGALGVHPVRSLWSTYERMMGVWDLAHWFLLAVVAASVLRTRGQWIALFSANLGVGLVLSLLAIAQAQGVRLLPIILTTGRADATLGNPTYLGAILAVHILLAVGLLVRSFVPQEEGQTPRRRRNRKAKEEKKAGWSIWGMRAFWGAAALVGLFALFLTGTRGALVGLAAGCLAAFLAALLFAHRGALRPLLSFPAALLLAVLLFAVDATVGLPTAPQGQGQTVGARTATLVRLGEEEASLRTRLESSMLGVRATLDRPLLGWGPENYVAAFNRHAEPRFFRYGIVTFDQAHNKVVEEATTRGVLGLLSYLALWGVMVWAVVRRRRPPREEVLAYAVLGALAGYFVQNLFLFDTPATMLQWTLLVAWVAAQERGGETTPSPAKGGQAGPPEDTPLLPVPWARAVVSLALLALLLVALIAFTYRPFRAATKVVQALTAHIPLEQRLATAREGFAGFPPLADLARAWTIRALLLSWPNLNPQEREQAAAFILSEAYQVLRSDPHDARVLMLLIFFLQQTAASPEDLPAVDALLAQLRTVAPGRPETYQLLANQALLRGDYREALRIVDDFRSKVPGVNGVFDEIRRKAEEGLNNKERGS